MRKKKSLFLRLAQIAEKGRKKKSCGIWGEDEKREVFEGRRSFSQKEKALHTESKFFFRKEEVQREKIQKEKNERVFYLPSSKEKRENEIRKEPFFSTAKQEEKGKISGRERRFQKEFWKKDVFSEQREAKDRQREYENLFFADVCQEKKEDRRMEELLRVFSEKSETDKGQSITIQIGQIRETADVDKVMEEMTKKLWEARSIGRSRVERRR